MKREERKKRMAILAIVEKLISKEKEMKETWQSFQRNHDINIKLLEEIKTHNLSGCPERIKERIAIIEKYHKELNQALKGIA